MSWIHIDDYVAQVLRLLQDAQARGPFNMAAPQPVSNAEFTRTLAHVLRRPAFFVAPGFMLKMTMGERSALLLESQRVLPSRLEAAGARFTFADLESALRALLP